MSGLTEEQAQAVDLATSREHRVCCLTGGPGTGKTYTITSILQRLRSQGRTFALAAPSGKAAQRMEKQTQHEAKTIHRLLKILPEQEDANPVQRDVVIVDESSMIDVPLMATFLRACFQAGGRVGTVLLVGDADQLPPVGPGRPFHDLVGSGTAPTVWLTVVKRQGEGSGIALAAQKIKRGRSPEFNRTDFRLVICEEAQDVPPVVWRELQGFAETGGGPETRQVLAPQRTLACGVRALNEHLEEARWGVSLEQKWGEEQLVRGAFRRGTKVIHTRNNYNLEVFNGELGFVVGAHAGAKPSQDRLTVDIAGSWKEYRGAGIKELQPAWALTVHKSQGSEWRDVIVVAHPAHSWMLTRSLLYVAATRARERVVIVGTEEAVAKAVRRVRDTRRRTMLAKWLADERRVG